MIEIRQHVIFAKWFDKLKDRTAKIRINVRIRRVSLGNLGDCKSLGGSLYELRVPYGPGYRVYFTYSGETVVLLLCGGDKSTQQVDIKKARELAKEE